MSGGPVRKALFLMLTCSLALSTPVSAQNQKAKPHASKGAQIDALNDQVDRLSAQGKYLEATTLLQRSLLIAEKYFGADGPQADELVYKLALLHEGQDRLGEAELLYKRSLAWRDRALSSEVKIHDVLQSLARVYTAQRRYSEALPVLERALKVSDKVFGTHSVQSFDVLLAIGPTYQRMGRYELAEAAYLRTLGVGDLGGSRYELILTRMASFYQEMGREAEASSLSQQLLAVRLVSQAREHIAVNRYNEAEIKLRRALEIRELALGSNHELVGSTQLALSTFYEKGQRYGDAEHALERSLAIYRHADDRYSPTIDLIREKLAEVYIRRNAWAAALTSVTESLQRDERDYHRGVYSVGAKGKTKTSYRSDRRLSHELVIRAGWRLAEQEPQNSKALAERALVASQWIGQNSADLAFSAMAGRFAKGDSHLPRLIREHQDLHNERESKSVSLTDQYVKRVNLSTIITPKSLQSSIDMIEGELEIIDEKIAAIDFRLRQDFPEYTDYARPVPLSLVGIQAQVLENEALVVFLDTIERPFFSDESFVWVVTRTDIRWARVELGSKGLAWEVAALRCGLDGAAWDGDGNKLCTKALAGPRTKPLSFDHARAHKLYSALFGQVQEVIKGKHLLVVPSGPLAQLPFQVLVTRAPVSGDHRAASWLVREHTITVLPAVSSLNALRRVGRPSSAPRPMIGIGNPLLVGPDARFASRAKQAQAKQRCPDRRKQQLAAANDHRTVPARIETRGGLASVADIKQQVPLPETADELCTVAQDLNAQTDRDILVGAKATEREVKRLSASGELAKYRMVHFATHGALAGELKGNDEPGLILTPPSKATEEDDGYLSASEIAGLKLDADLVILSACNTAAGAATGAEALSGLGRAFIYAQARALLVSHWAVYSDATVKLITGTMREMARGPQLGRAEALQRSMLELIDKGAVLEAHPAYWAPFVLVGDSGHRR